MKTTTLVNGGRGESKRTLDEEEVRDALVGLRKQLASRGAWFLGDVSFMRDVAKALGFDEADAAYICGRGESKRTLDEEEVRDALVELRKRLERDGSWFPGDATFMHDVARALGFDEVDAAYISGDIEELYKKARSAAMGQADERSGETW